MEMYEPSSPSISIGDLTDADIPAVVALHRRSLSYSINSRLGASHLASIYAFMKNEPSSLVQVARQGDRIVGVVSATLDPQHLKSAFMSGLQLAKKIKVGIQLVSRPMILLDLVNNRNVERPVTWEGQEVQPVLTAIAVDETVRRAGIGRQLVERVDAFVREHGCASYRLDTRSERARAFYGRLGFVEVEQRGADFILVKCVKGDHGHDP
jgi:ribosomal protein S18 acetylase RimI-like enzyme